MPRRRSKRGKADSVQPLADVRERAIVAAEEAPAQRYIARVVISLLRLGARLPMFLLGLSFQREKTEKKNHVFFLMWKKSVKKPIYSRTVLIITSSTRLIDSVNAETVKKGKWTKGEGKGGPQKFRVRLFCRSRSSFTQRSRSPSRESYNPL